MVVPYSKTLENKKLFRLKANFQPFEIWSRVRAALETPMNCNATRDDAFSRRFCRCHCTSIEPVRVKSLRGRARHVNIEQTARRLRASKMVQAQSRLAEGPLIVYRLLKKKNSLRNVRVLLNVY